MIERDGFYWIPLLPAEMREELEKLPAKKADWPADFRAEYQRRAAEFTAAVSTFRKWVRKDRHSDMTSSAKQMVYFLLDSLNFETGRCDPSHQAIADELGLCVRTVERMSQRIRCWVEVTRRGKTTTNFYRLRVSVAKVADLVEYSDSLREQRAEDRQRRRRFFPHQSEPTSVSGHSGGEPTFARGHEPTSVSGHEPTSVSGKHKKRTYEGEHKNEDSLSDMQEGTYPREDIPSDTNLFSRWIEDHIPDRSQHREAYRLLRERKMTPEILRRMAA
ncbi:MAG: hypothetical protein LCH99_24475 [Proteobacteria bacterium]|nr:hypothetical protein [Pseudomonadota bacterium]